MNGHKLLYIQEHGLLSSPEDNMISALGFDLIKANTELEAISFLEKSSADILLTKLLTDRQENKELLKAFKKNKMKNLIVGFADSNICHQSTFLEEYKEYEIDKILNFPVIADEVKLALSEYKSTVSQINCGKKEQIYQKTDLVNEQIRLVAMGQMTSEFIPSIFTPFSVLMGYLSLFKKLITKENNVEVIREKGLSYLNTILSHNDKVISILRGMQSLAMKKNSKKDICSIYRIIQDVLSIADIYLSNNNVKVYFKTFKQEKDLLIYASELEISLIFLNIILNACEAFDEKRNDQPKIWIQIFKENDEIKVEIENSGPEIPMKISEEIFKPYVSYKNKNTSHVSHTGLGLTLAKEFVEKNSGKIFLESDNESTKFIIQFTMNDENVIRN